MRTDSDIKKDVEDELKYDADVGSTDVAVAVKGGVVALTGFVRSYSQKLHCRPVSVLPRSRPRLKTL
jgi:osmotically-inducible protein OsmY